MAALIQPLAQYSGGLRLDPHKSESTRVEIGSAPIPARLTLPLHQHIGEAAQARVSPGDRVFKGEQIAAAHGYISSPVHASSSGTVVAIEDRPVPHPSGLSASCIVIETDGDDRWHPDLAPVPDYTTLDPAELRNRVRDAGIVGLGGAGFPTYIKMNPGARKQIDLLILNAVECEPYITCDEMLCRERADHILSGLMIMRHALNAAQCVIAVEDNMPLAAESLRSAAGSLRDKNIHVVDIPAIYPAGGEKQLIKVLTGEEVPANGLPVDIGVVCHNAGTAYAVHEAIIEGRPLVSRIITITGTGVVTPRNVEARIGTPISELITTCGGYMDDASLLTMGGPMMGFTLESDQVPAIKTTNCLLVSTPATEPVRFTQINCIRCGDCADVCPADLLPQHLYWHARDRDLDKAREFDLFDCIECGCCAYVCPSHIPLVDYYRFAKSEIWAREKEKEKSDIARQRHETRQHRLEMEKQARAQRQQEKRRALEKSKNDPIDPKKAQIEAALARVAEKKARRAETGNTDGQPDN